MINRQYFFLEPYVHVQIRKNKGLLYNTLSGDYIHVDSGVVKYLKQLKSNKNLYVIELPLCISKELNTFIKHAKALYIGDTTLNIKNGLKPVQQMPILNIQHDIKRTDDKYGQNCLTYLSNLTLFINNARDPEINKQFFFCSEDLKVIKEMPFGLLERLISMNIKKLNILGSDIFTYPNFDLVVNMLDRISSDVSIFSNYLNKGLFEYGLELLANTSLSLSISVSSNFNPKVVEYLLIGIKEKKVNAKFDFAIESISDVEHAEKWIKKLVIENFTLKPYFNGKNLNLFESAVFVEKDDIFEAKPAQKDIFARMSVNQLNFGKLIVLPSGKVYSNLSQPKLGNINQQSISELIYKEIYNRKNWFRLRKNVTPCKSCICNTPGPPISNYEYVIGKYNLCHVWKN